MSRPGSNSGTANPTPFATPTAEQGSAGTELSSVDASSGAAPDTDPPFGDWREQLRDRVKEIRARKLVDKRPIDPSGAELSQPADAARSEKLQTARDHAAITSSDTAPSSPLDTATDSADLANLMDALLNPPEGLEPLLGPSPPAPLRDAELAEPQAQVLGEFDLDPVGVEYTQPVNSVLETPELGDNLDIRDTPAPGDILELGDSLEPEGSLELGDSLEIVDVPVPGDTAPIFQEDPVTPPNEEVPLFQDEAQLIEDNPLNEVVEETPEERRSEPHTNRQEPPPLDGFRTEMPDWAKVRGPIEPAAPTPRQSAPPDLDAIPNELSDVAIPTWALPRQRDDGAAGAFAAGAPGQLNADALLAGDPLEHSPSNRAPAKAEATTRQDRAAPTNARPADTKASIEPKGLVQQDVHIISEYVAGTPSARRSTLDDLSKEAKTPAPATENHQDPPAPRSVRTPNDWRQSTTPAPTAADESDVLAVEPAAPFEPPVQSPPEAHREDPPAMANDWAPEQDHGSRGFPGLFDPAGAPSVESDALTDAAASATEFTPRSAMDTAMEWDLETPSDPDTILDAQRDPMDPTAPMSDRVFSALADGLVLTTIAVLLMFGGASAAGTGVLSFVSAAPVPFAVAWLIFGLSYGIFFVGTCGQTLGKMAMRIRVIGSSNFRVGYAKATVRAVSYAAAMLPAGLGLLLALKDMEHRALHDRLSGTRVVKA